MTVGYYGVSKLCSLWCSCIYNLYMHQDNYCDTGALFLLAPFLPLQPECTWRLCLGWAGRDKRMEEVTSPPPCCPFTRPCGEERPNGLFCPSPLLYVKPLWANSSHFPAIVSPPCLPFDCSILWTMFLICCGSDQFDFLGDQEGIFPSRQDWHGVWWGRGGSPSHHPESPFLG